MSDMTTSPDLLLDAGPLLALHGLADDAVTVRVTSVMSGLEADPRDDWLHVALCALTQLARESFAPERMAIIGTGNGIDAIAALRTFPTLRELVLTDVLPEVLAIVAENVERHRGTHTARVHTVAGRDCESLDGGFDLIYANLPLLMVPDDELGAERATTTLTPYTPYAALARAAGDPLRRYSLLSQLGFLHAATAHLAPDGRIVTLIGGRIPAAVVDECFARANLRQDVAALAFMRQSDAEFLEQYAAAERREAIAFEFFEYAEAARRLGAAGVEAPGIITGSSLDAIRALLVPARVDAATAQDRERAGEHVGHLALAYVAEAR
jgi:methylase of polypeptide subunit release factors